MKEDVLECLCERPQEAMESLENLSDVREVALFGKGIHIVVEEADKAVENIRRTLVERGFKVFQIGKIIPSLEDVFVSLIEARDRVEQPQAEVRK